MADVFVQSILSDTNISSPNPAASLDREELNALLDAIDSKTKTLEHAVFDTVKESADIFLDSWTNSQSTTADVQVLLQDLDTVQREVYNDDNGIQMVVKTSLAEYNDVVNQVSNNQNIIDSLEALVPIVDQLKYVDSQLAAGYLVETRRLLEELENSVYERFRSSKWDSVQAIHVIRRSLGITKTGLIEALEECIRNSITFDIQSPVTAQNMEAGTTFKMNVVYQSLYKSRKAPNGEGVPITLSEVFTCISLLGSLEAHMQPVKLDIYRHIIVPLLEHTQQLWTVNVHEVNDNQATLMLTSNGKDDDIELDPVSTIRNLDAVFDFFYKYLFGNATQPRSQNLLFGNMVVPGAFELLITHTLRPSVPSTVEKLNRYAEVASRVQVLEQKFESYNFMANQDEAALTKFVDNIDRFFSLKLKGKILVNARKVMLRKIYDAELADDGVNGAMNYFVTQTPRLLIVLVNDTIGTAQKIAEEHPTSSIELWNTITELVDLYRALMPTYHGETYTSNFNNAMLFRNDCYWLASRLSDLAKANPHYGILLETSAQKLCQLGGVWYELTVGRIVTQINMVLDRTDRFATISQDPRMPDIVGQAITDAVDTALRFSAVVQEALDDDLFLQTMSHVANAIVGRLISDIEEMHDIGEEESHLIARSLNGTMSLIDMFSRHGRPDATDAVVGDHVKDWKKFWIIRNMLEMSFRDIMELFHDGELQCFETNELCELLCALFADTELRQNNLKEIQRGYQPKYQMESFNRTLPTETVDDDEVMQEDNGWEPFDDDLQHHEYQDEVSAWEPFDTSEQDKASQQQSSALEPLEPMEEDYQAEESGWDDEPIVHHQEQMQEPTAEPEAAHDTEIAYDDEPGWELDEPIVLQQEQDLHDIPAHEVVGETEHAHDDDDDDGWDDEPILQGHNQDQELPEEHETTDESNHAHEEGPGWELDEPIVDHQDQEESAWEVDEPIVHHDQDESGWEVDEPIVSHDHEEDQGWEVDDPLVHQEYDASNRERFDRSMEEPWQPRPHVQSAQSSSSSLSGMRDNLNRTSSPRLRSSVGASSISVNSFRQSSPRPQHESFGNLFSGTSRGTPSPRPVSPKHRTTSSGRESPFTSLLGNIIGATPSPKPEQQETRQTMSGLGLPSLDVLNYASNRIAGEFTNVVGNMIGAGPARQSHSPATPDLVTSKPMQYNRSPNKGFEDGQSSRLDFLSHNIDEDNGNGKKTEGEEEGWDW